MLRSRGGGQWWTRNAHKGFGLRWSRSFTSIFSSWGQATLQSGPSPEGPRWDMFTYWWTTARRWLMSTTEGAQDQWSWFRRPKSSGAIVLWTRSLLLQSTWQADWMSKPIWSPDEKLDETIFQALGHIWGPMEMDLFADRLNKQLPAYANWKPDPWLEWRMHSHGGRVCCMHFPRSAW